jgi:hypothetical protein
MVPIGISGLVADACEALETQETGPSLVEVLLDIEGSTIPKRGAERAKTHKPAWFDPDKPDHPSWSGLDEDL